MLIYHKTDNKLMVTQVMTGISKSGVSHFEKRVEDVPESHLTGVRDLSNNGNVFVTGGTYKGAIYKGKFELRKSFKHLLDK